MEHVYHIPEQKEAALKRNIEKAEVIYKAIDESKIFEGTAKVEDRSLMNICFVLKE